MKEIYKNWAELKSDKEAEDFIANSDLTQYDWDKLRPVRFEFTQRQRNMGGDTKNIKNKNFAARHKD